MNRAEYLGDRLGEDGTITGSPSARQTSVSTRSGSVWMGEPREPYGSAKVSSPIAALGPVASYGGHGGHGSGLRPGPPGRRGSEHAAGSGAVVAQSVLTTSSFASWYANC